MISKIWSKYRRDGLQATAHAMWQALFPARISSIAELSLSLSGKVGLEVGGPSSMFGDRGLIPIYRVAARLDNCFFSGENVWRTTSDQSVFFHFHKNKTPGKQYIGEASDLSMFADDTYDFILSSHCLEHVANPIKALLDWKRVLKSGGVLVFVLPHKDGTFDRRRPVTTLQHMVDDYDGGVDESDLTHVEEVTALHYYGPGEKAGARAELEAQARDNFTHRTLHHHVFDTNVAIELVEHAGFSITSAHAERPHEVVIIAKKPKDESSPITPMDDGARSQLLGASPFPSDRAHSG